MVSSKPMPQSPVERARELRKSQSPPEGILWSKLRDRRLCCLKFRRQHPLGPYTADFFCAEASLVIEIDGREHAQRREEDHQRDRWMADHGLQTIRIPASEVSKSVEIVLRHILHCARERAAQLARAPESRNQERQ